MHLEQEAVGTRGRLRHRDEIRGAAGPDPGCEHHEVDGQLELRAEGECVVRAHDEGIGIAGHRFLDPRPLVIGHAHEQHARVGGGPVDPSWSRA